MVTKKKGKKKVTKKVSKKKKSKKSVYDNLLKKVDMFESLPDVKNLGFIKMKKGEVIYGTIHEVFKSGEYDQLACRIVNEDLGEMYLINLTKRLAKIADRVGDFVHITFLGDKKQKSKKKIKGKYQYYKIKDYKVIFDSPSEGW